METLELLGVALGLATLSGINLYLTVFVTGLAIRFEWIHLAAHYEPLAVLGDPAIITVAGILYSLEFFADKIPWVDTLNDSIQTFIRPAGGVLLAITALGDASPVYSVIVGLLAGGMSLTAHAAKAGVRIVANASPEPFSNMALSIGEDVTVLAGLGLIYSNPVIALALSVATVLIAILVLPRLFRAAKTTLWFVWKRISYALTGREAEGVAGLPPKFEIALGAQNVRGDVKWVAPCIAKSGLRAGKNAPGWLLSVGPGLKNLYFASACWRGPRIEAVPLDSHNATHEPGAVCDRVTIFSHKEGSVLEFLFDRTRRGAASRLASAIRSRMDTVSERELVVLTP